MRTASPPVKPIVDVQKTQIRIPIANELPTTEVTDPRSGTKIATWGQTANAALIVSAVTSGAGSQIIELQNTVDHAMESAKFYDVRTAAGGGTNSLGTDDRIMINFPGSTPKLFDARLIGVNSAHTPFSQLDGLGSRIVCKN